LLDLELGPDCPNVFLPQGRVGPISFPLFQGIRLSVGRSELALSCMVVLLGYRGGRDCRACRRMSVSRE
jgi:hypothetical protein